MADTLRPNVRLPNYGIWAGVSAQHASDICAFFAGKWDRNRYVIDGDYVLLLADHPNFPPCYLARVA